MDLAEAVAQGLHNRSPVVAAEGEEQYEAFIDRFPRSVWESMRLQEYALGTDATRLSYCYALEWGTTRLGSIRGGSSLKHVIFKRKSGDWYYPATAVSVDEAWASLRQGYQQALRLADEGNWAQIADIPALRAAKVDKLKTLYLYHRDQILPAYSQEHLKHFASRLGLTVDEDIVLLNRRILAHLAGVPGLESANSLELSTLLYAWASPPGYDVPDYVKIAPGPRADKWSECLAGEYICVGWDEVGDLSLFETEEEFRVAFTESQATSNRSLTTRKARELWRLTQLAAGRQGGG